MLKFVFVSHIILACAISAANAQNAQNALIAEPARCAEEFIDSIGLATHWGYRNTVYGKKWSELKELIGELGVRHTRTGWDPRVA